MILAAAFLRSKGNNKRRKKQIIEGGLWAEWWCNSTMTKRVHGSGIYRKWIACMSHMYFVCILHYLDREFNNGVVRHLPKWMFFPIFHCKPWPKMSFHFKTYTQYCDGTMGGPSFWMMKIFLGANSGTVKFFKP